MSSPKPATHIEVGESYAPYSFRVTPDLNEQYCFAEQDYDPRYREKTEAGPPLVHRSRTETRLRQANRRTPNWRLI